MNKVWQQFEAIYLTAFDASIYDLAMILKMHGNKIPKLQIIFRELEQQKINADKVLKNIILPQVRKTDPEKFPSLIFRTYLLTIVMQFKIIRMQRSITKQKWNDKTSARLNDIYRKCIRVDKHLQIIQRDLVDLKVKIPADILDKYTNQVCDGATRMALKYRLANMLRFFLTISDVTGTCSKTPEFIPHYDLKKLHWSEILFLHRMHSVLTKKSPSGNVITIDNTDSPLVYYDLNPDKYYTDRVRRKTHILGILRKAHDYNQYGLKHKYYCSPQDRANKMNTLHVLDKEIDDWVHQKKKGGITKIDAQNPLGNTKVVNTKDVKYLPAGKSVTSTKGSGKWSLILKHNLGAKWVLQNVCGQSTFSRFEDLPNAFGLSQILSRGSNYDLGGYTLNKYMESWTEANKFENILQSETQKPKLHDNYTLKDFGIKLTDTPDIRRRKIVTTLNNSEKKLLTKDLGSWNAMVDNIVNQVLAAGDSPAILTDKL